MKMDSHPSRDTRGTMRLLLLLVVASAFVACVYGIRTTPLFMQSHWAEPRTSAITAFIVIAAMLAGLPSARALNFSYSMGVAGLLLLIAGAFAGIGPVVAVLLQLVSAFCIGSQLLGRAPLAQALGNGFSCVLATVLGLAVQSFVVCALSFFPANNPATYLVLLLAPIVFRFRTNARTLTTLMKGWHESSIGEGRFWLPLMNALIATALLLKLLAVLQPEIGADALATHLVIADQLKAHGRFHYDVTESIWAVMPMASDWQFALANMLSSEIGARLVNFAAEILSCTLIFMAGRYIKGALAGTAAVLLYVSTPLTQLETTSLFTENFWTLWFLGALIVGVASVRLKDSRIAAASGFLIGTTLAAKAITIFLAPFFLAIAVAWLFPPSKQFVKKVAVFGVAALVAGSIPYLNAWISTGNPVFPFMNDVFQSPFYETSVAFDNPLFKKPLEWRSLYDMTFRSGDYLEFYPGAFGIGFLLFLPAALLYSLWRSWAFRIGALCVILFVAGVFHFQSYLRYILPILPLAAVAIGLLVADLSGRSKVPRVIVLSLLVASAAVGLYLTPSSNYYYRSNTTPTFWGSDEQREELYSVRPERSLTRVIDAMNFERVLWLGAPYIAGTDADVYVVNWHGGRKLISQFNSIASPEAFQKFVTDGKFDAIAVASEFDACERPGICEFLDGKTSKVFSLGAAALYVPRLELLLDHEMLTNTRFDHSVEGWAGNGIYVSDGDDGAVVVSALKSFSQTIKVTENSLYMLEVHGRCTADKGDYRAQVNWFDQQAAFITTNITVIPCSSEYSAHSAIVRAPQNATSAAVYASGHEPDLTAEITEVSFRNDQND